MRIRSIKPEFWRSEDIAALDWPTRLLFVGLWSYVDDNGVGRDVPKVIVADLFALEDDPRETLATVSRGLAKLSEAGLIERYTVDRKHFLHVTSWDSHQRIDKPNKARYPLPTCENAIPRETLATPSRDSRETPAPGTGEQGNRGTGENGSPVGTSPERHDQFGSDLETVSPETVFPRSWSPANRHKAYALENGLDLTHEAHMFAEHARANGRTAVDWDAAFMTWLGRAKPRATGATGTNRAAQTLALAARYEAQEGADRDQITDRKAAR